MSNVKTGILSLSFSTVRRTKNILLAKLNGGSYNQVMILNVFKPRNWTSRDVVNKITHILREKKVGHAGTLDPLAEGVLVVLTGKDTKRQEDFMKLPKKYYFEAVFGVTTDTDDLESIPVFKCVPTLDTVKENIPALLDRYSGDFEQKVPLYSAKKVSGVPLYKNARKLKASGLQASNTELPTNKVSIYEYTIIDYAQKEIETDKGTKTLPLLKCEVRSSHGMYVRALVRDLGNDLGFGAVASKIERLAVGNLNIADSVSIESLEEIYTKNSRFKT